MESQKKKKKVKIQTVFSFSSVLFLYSGNKSAWFAVNTSVDKEDYIR